MSSYPRGDCKRASEGDHNHAFGTCRDQAVQILRGFQALAAFCRARVQAMNKFSLPFTEMLHENLPTVMCFAYSRKSLNEMVERVFMGEWKYLRKALFEIPHGGLRKHVSNWHLFCEFSTMNGAFPNTRHRRAILTIAASSS